MNSNRPNILLFVSDDHAQWASGCYGSRAIPTPNIEYLAAHGVRFTNAFTPSPVCSPARASLFTGRLPSQHGIHDWLEDLGPMARHPALNGQITLPELLQSSGYHTGLIGKWHCDVGPGPASGFDRWFSYWHDQFPHRGKQRFSDEGRLVEERGHQSPLFTDRAVDFLRRRPTDRPFFLVVGYVDSHSPWTDHPDRLVRISGDAGTSIPNEPFADCHGEPFLRIPADPAAHRRRQAQHAAGIRMIDEQIGRVLDELDGQSLLDQTLTIYTSDHGLMCGQHGTYGKGNGTTPQNFLDESIRVPLVLSWPDDVATHGGDCDAIVDHCDLFMTLLDATGTELEPTIRETLHFPGGSFLPLVQNDIAQPWRDAQYCEYGNARMIRTQAFKYIERNIAFGRRYENELYDLQEDPRETTNVVAQPKYEVIVSQLSQKLHEHFARHSEPTRDGWDIEHQPRCNNDMPWLRGIESATPEGRRTP